jgi:TolB-like protein/predicted Zn-dependent protease
VDGRTLFAFFLSTHLNHSEALAQLDHAMSLDPLSPYPSWAKEWVLLWARKYDQLTEQHKRTATLEPNFFYMDSFVGAAYREKGMFREALDEYLRVQNSAPEQPLYGLAILYARMGKRTEARKILRDLEVYSTKRYVPASTIGMIYASLGDRDRAFEWFDRAYQDRDVILVVFAVTPEHEPVRSDPRFTDLLKKMGLQAQETDKGSSSSSIEKSKTEPTTEWQNSIAVLPFKNISADKEQEYFCDGMTEQLITNLTNLPNVKVIARTSVMQFKNTDKTIPQIAQELGVAHVLEGSVRKSGNKIRVTAQLIKAEDGFHLWAKDYDRQLKDIFAVQDDVSNAIVAALKVNLSFSRQHSMVTTAPKNTEAYDLYLRGNFFLHKSDEESLNRALDYFKKSIEKDRSYALSYAGIANAYVYLADAYLPPNDAYPKAKSSALKALELDSTIAEARAALAYILGAYERDRLSSQREFRRAMEFNPNSVDLLQLSAAYLGARTGSAEAIAQADRAIALDPLNPSARWTKEKVLYDARQYDEVIEQHKRTVELDPNFFYSDSWVSLAYREKGMLKEALDEYVKVQKVMPKQPLFGLAILYGRMRRQQEAKNILRDVINESTKRYIAPTGIAMVYISLGEKDLAFNWLDRAYEAHDPFLDGLKTDVRYDPIHSDPRYTVLLKKMGFEK